MRQWRLPPIRCGCHLLLGGSGGNTPPLTCTGAPVSRPPASNQPATSQQPARNEPATSHSDSTQPARGAALGGWFNITACCRRCWCHRPPPQCNIAIRPRAMHSMHPRVATHLCGRAAGCCAWCPHGCMPGRWPGAGQMEERESQLARPVHYSALQHHRPCATGSWHSHARHTHATHTQQRRPAATLPPAAPSSKGVAAGT